MCFTVEQLFSVDLVIYSHPVMALPSKECEKTPRNQTLLNDVKHVRKTTTSSVQRVPTGGVVLCSFLCISTIICRISALYRARHHNLFDLETASLLMTPSTSPPPSPPPLDDLVTI